MADSTVRIGLVLPDVMGTYGDGGNAVVLRQRLRLRGIPAEIVETYSRPLPGAVEVETVLRRAAEASASAAAGARR